MRLLVMCVTLEKGNENEDREGKLVRRPFVRVLRPKTKTAPASWLIGAADQFVRLRGPDDLSLHQRKEILYMGRK